MSVPRWKQFAALAIGFCAAARHVPAQIGTGEPIAPRLVKLTVVALDNRGRPISDLTADDFQITDAGKPRKLTLFRHSDSKLQLAPRLAPGELSNRAATNIPHATLVLFDLLNESFATRGGAQSYLIHGLQALESADDLFLYLLTINGQLYPVHPLPSAGGEASGQGSGAPWTKDSKALIEQAVSKVYGLRRPDLDIDTRVRLTYTSLENVARLLAAVPGRKNIVWVTHGVPISLGPQSNFASDYIDYTPMLRRLTETLDRDNVSIYPVQQSPPGMAPEGTPEARYSGLGSEDTLQQFADLTGGGMKFSGDIGAAIRQAMSDVRTSYLLGYSQPPEEWDGKFHKLHVVSTRKGVRLQFKTGYYAGAEIPNEEQESLEQAMKSSFDAAEIGVRGKLTPEPGGKNLRLDCRIDAADIQVVQAGNVWVAHLALQVEGINAGGDAERTTVMPLDLNLNADEHAKTLAEGIPWDKMIPRNDGWTRLRVAVFDRDSHAVGSLTLPVPK
jgi:VWFA-related protein